MIMNNLFPTPVAKFELGRNFTTEEMDFCIGQEVVRNSGNGYSNNRYVLTDTSMTGLKNFIQSCVDEYFNSVYAPKYDVRLRITQSWFNYSKPGEWHHNHAHPNSFVSGVLYMKATKDSDRIYFYPPRYRPIDIPAKEYNLYNSKSWWIGVETGALMLFPSSLTHSVERVTADDTRISLAFNTFPVGYVGDEDALTALYLEN